MSYKGPVRKAVGDNSVWPVTDFKGDKGFTVQADRDDADINIIISRYQKSGVLPPISRGEPFYGDVSEFSGLADAMIKIKEADELFMTYPAEVRERFDNDKVKFVDFLDNPDNRDEAIELGLILKPVVPETPAPVNPAPGPVKPV
ncbi:MAG: internal scaffolding protein [Microvirus sp.]|nr:MAG: internal scaffolding protein [Microvirus sp.]